MSTLTNLEYARLALEPDEALRNIFLGLCSKTGLISSQDFVKFINESGALDNIRGPLQSILGSDTRTNKESNNLSVGEDLDFQKFKIAMVLLFLLVEICDEPPDSLGDEKEPLI